MNRRSLLKQFGMIGSAAVATSPVSGSSDRKSQDTVDTNFDASDREETAKFILSVFNAVQEKTQAKTQEVERSLEERLNPEQKQAIGKYLENNAVLRQEENISVGEEEDAKQTSYGTFDHTVSTEIELYLCTTTGHCSWYTFDAYDYTHELNWEYDGDTVSSGSASTTGNGNNYALVKWTYEGDEDSDITYHSDDLYVKSYRQGYFVQSILIDGYFDENNYPEIELMGDNSGRGNVTDTTPK